MLKNRDKVLAKLETIRSNAQDYFIPLGTHDESTDSKREISNITGTLYNRLPHVKAMVDSLGKHPVYVGYDGNAPANQIGRYWDNILILHDRADEESKDFITAYTHELTHADQDRRGLFRKDAPLNTEELTAFIKHHLVLEAAAYATEVTSLYYMAHFSGLEESHPEVVTYFDEYCAENPGHEALPFLIEENLDVDEVESFSDMKKAWRSVFISFFEPDSKRADFYISRFCQDYLQRLKNTETLTDEFNQRPWATMKDLKAITTLPGLGPMFSEQALEVVNEVIRSNIVREKNLPILDLTRSQAPNQEIDGAKLLKALTQLKNGQTL